MPALREYTETVQLMTYRADGMEHRVILPSALDLASHRKKISDVEKELERLAGSPAPLEIRSARKSLETGKLAGEALAAAQAKVATYEAEVLGEQKHWEATLWRSQRMLDDMEDLAGQALPDGMEREARRFEMREYSHGTFLACTEDHSELVEIGGVPQKRVLVEARNLALLGKSLLGEWLPLPEDAVGNVHVQTFGDERCFLGAIADPSELQGTLAEILVGRMNAVNMMSPELIRFFSPRPRPLRAPAD